MFYGRNKLCTAPSNEINIRDNKTVAYLIYLFLIKDFEQPKLVRDFAAWLRENSPQLKVFHFCFW